MLQILGDTRSVFRKAMDCLIGISGAKMLSAIRPFISSFQFKGKIDFPWESYMTSNICNNNLKVKANSFSDPNS